MKTSHCRPRLKNTALTGDWQVTRLRKAYHIPTRLSRISSPSHPPKKKTDNAPAGVEDFDVQKKGVNPELQKQLDDHIIVQSDGDVQDILSKQFHNLPFPRGKDMITEKAPLGSLWCIYFRTVNGSTSAPSLVISKCRWLSSAASNSAEFPTVLITSPRLML